MTSMRAHKGATNSLMPILGWIVLIASAIALGLYAKPLELEHAANTGPVFPRVPPPPPSFSILLHQLGVGSVIWYAVVLALPCMLWRARRLDAARLGKRSTIVLSSAVLVFLIAGTSVVDYLVVYRGAPSRPSAASYLTVALRQNVLPWLVLAGVVTLIEGRRRAQRSALERERLRAEVAEQRLIALTGQLEPHFLFNTLQGISTLIHRDANAADAMLGKLADLLRDLLRHRDRVFVPLEDELRYARTYLEIAELRFADRLAFSIDVPAELSRSAVPLFILQPLVENALTHGIGARMQGGSIKVSACRRGDRLHLEVADDGAGIAMNGAARESIGLSNTRERLRASFGVDQSFALEPGAAGGTVARIDIPYQPYASSVESA